MVNRRMFRPSFADAKEQPTPRPQHNGGRYRARSPLRRRSPTPRISTG